LGATDPWTTGAKASNWGVRPVARAIKIKHAGLNSVVQGSVIIDCEFKHYNTVGGKGIPER